MNIANLTVSIRLLVGGQGVALWRLKVLGRLARLLRVPVEIKVEGRQP